MIWPKVPGEKNILKGSQGQACLPSLNGVKVK